ARVKGAGARARAALAEGKQRAASSPCSAKQCRAQQALEFGLQDAEFAHYAPSYPKARRRINLLGRRPLHLVHVEVGMACQNGVDPADEFMRTRRLEQYRSVAQGMLDDRGIDPAPRAAQRRRERIQVLAPALGQIRLQPAVVHERIPPQALLALV